MYTLVVVDMQPNFSASNGRRVRKNCLREIKRAMKDGAHIIFLEYIGHGVTLPELMKPVNDYQYYCVKSKSDDDGSAEVQEAVFEKGFMIGRFRMIGINTDWCVRATAAGLRNRFPNSFVEVVEDACDSNDDHHNGIWFIEQLDNVDVV